MAQVKSNWHKGRAQFLKVSNLKPVPSNRAMFSALSLTFSARPHRTAKPSLAKWAEPYPIFNSAFSEPGLVQDFCSEAFFDSYLVLLLVAMTVNPKP